MCFELSRYSLGARGGRRALISLGAVMAHVWLICAGITVSAQGRGAGTLELFATRSSISGGPLSQFDTYRKVECIAPRSPRLSGGGRFGAPFNRYLGLEFTIRMIPGAYKDSLHDSRVAPPDPYADGSSLSDEGVAFLSDLSLICRYPIGSSFEPYVAAGIGRIVGSDDVSGTVTNAGVGLIIYPFRRMGLRFDFRHSRANISGYVEQDNPRRAIPFHSKLKLAEISLGIIVRFLPPLAK